MNTKKLTLIAVIFCFQWTVSGQVDFKFPVEYLHGNQIRAAVGQGSMNCWDYDDAKFQVPYTGPHSPSTLFATALWISGLDDQGNVHVSYENYGRLNPHFLPGPLPQYDTPISPEETRQWNKIFKVSGQDILAHIEDYKDGHIDHPIESIYGWPASHNVHFFDIHGFVPDFGNVGGAPFYETPGNENNIYEPELGEYPMLPNRDLDVIPAEMTWAVYNNAQQQVNASPDHPMIVEIQQTSYALNCDSEVLQQSIFHHYKIISRTKSTIRDCRLALWADPDLGCPTDDYVGCDPASNTFYVYNEDLMDGYMGTECPDGTNTYENHPPVQTITFLNQNLESFSFYNNGVTGGTIPQTADPSTDGEFRHYMEGKWRDGTPMTRGGTGYNPGSTDTTRFLFPDNPNDISGWSMYTESPPPGDRRVLGIASLGTFESGQIWNLEVAFTYHNSPDSNHIQNVNLALRRVAALQSMYDEGMTDCTMELCECDCVWPGDANSDGIVDYLDAVNIIQAFDHQGSMRDHPYPFLPVSVSDWATSTYNQTNSKYADVDGNGRVDLSDLELIDDYLGRKNHCYDERPELCPNGTEVYIDFENWRSDYPSLSIGRGSIVLKSTNNFWGLSYRFKYDTSLFVMAKAPDGPVWSDGNLANLSFSHYSESLNAAEFQQVFFNNGKKNATLPQPADNSIGKFVMIKKTPPKSYPSQYATLEICDFIVYYKDGSRELLPTQKRQFLLPDSITTSVSTMVDHEVHIHPNPTHGRVFLDKKESWDRVIVRNVQGQIMLSTSSEEIDLSSFGTGLYFLEIKTQGRTTGYARVVKQ